MGKSAMKKPRLPKANPKAEEESNIDPAPILLSSDDEADDDLSLKIVEKAKLRACGNKSNANPSSSSVSREVIVTEFKKKVWKTRERKKEKMKPQDNAVEDSETKEEGGAPKESDATAPKEIDETLETNPLEKSDNIVLRKLLRGPRYFDPPDNSWGNCYNCGESGHAAVNCTSAKRKKPCFVCGSFEHNVKQCNKGKDCFICKKGGHRAKDCPEKSFGLSQNTKLCLKCGDSGHEMFSCRSSYSQDDLKEIQCYVCNCFGHLCCVSYADAGPREVSCYRCGQLGHTGWECARVHAETISTATPSSCYTCGEGGHKARNCASSVKKEKRKSEFSSPRKSRSRDKYESHVGVRSVPHDLGKARKRHKKTQHDHDQQPSSSQSKPRGRGGWITEDPGDYDNHNRSRGSPKTPNRYNNSNGYNNYNYNYSHNSGSRSNGRYQYGSAVASNPYQHKYSASRFGNSSNYGKREYSWDY